MHAKSLLAIINVKNSNICNQHCHSHLTTLNSEFTDCLKKASSSILLRFQSPLQLLYAIFFNSSNWFKYGSQRTKYYGPDQLLLILLYIGLYNQDHRKSYLQTILHGRLNFSRCRIIIGADDRVLFYCRPNLTFAI